MTNDDIPLNVREFLHARINSVPQLEALLLLWRRLPNGMSPDELAKLLYVDAYTARRLATELQRRGLVKTSSSTLDEFLFDAAWDADGTFMRVLDETYRTKLVRVATLIHAHSSSAVRDFARAFDLKKE